MARGQPITKGLRAQIAAVYGETGSQRQTAAQVGVGKTSVQRVLRLENKRRRRRPSEPALGKGQSRLDEPEICPGCHVVIDVVPCQECGPRRYIAAMREWFAQHGAPLKAPAGSRVGGPAPRHLPRLPDEEIQLQLDLAPTERAALDKLRDEKQRRRENDPRRDPRGKSQAERRHSDDWPVR